MPRLFKTFLLLSALILWNAAHGQVPATVRQGLREARVPQASVSIVVQEVGARRAALALNAEASRNPASVMKLVTTYAALELQGPAYRWRTDVYQDGNDLIHKGYGDPKLNYESFWMLLRSLRGRGLREIRGDVVLDRSHFAPLSLTPIDHEMFRPYNVAPDPLLVNFKSLRFVFLLEGDKVRVFVEPNLPGLELINTLKISEGACPEGRAFRDLIQASFQSKPPRAAFTGPYPVSCGERDLNVALHHPEDYVGGMIRTLWAEMGGSWSGRIREGVVPANAKLLYTHESEPLSEIVRDINKFSKNVMSRQLYLTLAA
jgi:D-alanyl-D-alanine carboxypeptidase/D-alanyl-D-alanine-endopeptidase (penicillin-binding protein 4)